MEIWKDIEGYEGKYQISDLGNVKSLERYSGRKFVCERMMKLREDKDGYLTVGLWTDKKQKWLKIHRLIALAFVENPLGKSLACHKDGDNKNNLPSNLYWGTEKENKKDSMVLGTSRDTTGENSNWAKLNVKQVRLIKHLKTIKPKMLAQEVGNVFNAHRETIGRIWRGLNWKKVII